MLDGSLFLPMRVITVLSIRAAANIGITSALGLGFGGFTAQIGQ